MGNMRRTAALIASDLHLAWYLNSPIVVHRSRHEDNICAQRAERLILLLEALVAIVQQGRRRPQHDRFEADHLLLGDLVELEILKPLRDVPEALVVVDLVCNIQEHGRQAIRCPHKPLFIASTGGEVSLFFEQLVVLLADVEEESHAMLAQEVERRNTFAEHGLEALVHDLVEPRPHHCPHLGPLVLGTCPDIIRCCV